MPDAITRFWIPIATILPIFIVAMALEMRANARVWRFEQPIARRLTSVAFLGYGVVTALAELNAMFVLATGNASIGWRDLAMTAIVYGLSIVLINPLLFLLVRAWVDLPIQLRKFPTSRASRDTRKNFRELKNFEHLLEQSEAQIRQHQQAIAVIKQQAQGDVDAEQLEAWDKTAVDVEQTVIGLRAQLEKLKSDADLRKPTEAEVRRYKAIIEDDPFS